MSNPKQNLDKIIVNRGECPEEWNEMLQGLIEDPNQ